MTPTKMRVKRELTIKNDGQEDRVSFPLFIKEYLAELEARDSKGRNLVILPTSQVSQATREAAMAMGKKPVEICLGESLVPSAMEIITVGFLMTIPSERVKRRFLIHSVTDEVTVQPESSSVYFVVSAPANYELQTQFEESEGRADGSTPILTEAQLLRTGRIEEGGLHKDANSCIFRLSKNSKPLKFTYRIVVPSSVRPWLLAAAILGTVAPIFSAALFIISREYFISSIALIAGTYAALIAMRAWLFTNIDLLKSLSKYYLVWFFANILVFAGIIAVLVWTRFIPTTML